MSRVKAEADVFKLDAPLEREVSRASFIQEMNEQNLLRLGL